jgi:hypothetical protein
MSRMMHSAHFFRARFQEGPAAVRRSAVRLARSAIGQNDVRMEKGGCLEERWGSRSRGLLAGPPPPCGIGAARNVKAETDSQAVRHRLAPPTSPSCSPEPPYPRPLSESPSESPYPSLLPGHSESLRSCPCPRPPFPRPPAGVSVPPMTSEYLRHRVSPAESSARPVHTIPSESPFSSSGSLYPSHPSQRAIRVSLSVVRVIESLI